MKPQNLVFLDFETGGRDCKLSPITQVGIVVTTPDFKELTKWSCFVKPYGEYKTIEKGALEYTMTTMRDINNGLDAKEVVKTIINILKKANVSGGREQGRPTIVGHNISFDIAFMRLLFNHCNKELFSFLSSNNGEIDRMDTMKLAMWHWFDLPSSDNQSMSLTNCLKRIEVELVDAHGALNDVFGTIALMKYFMSRMSTDSVISNIDMSSTTSKRKQGFQF